MFVDLLGNAVDLERRPHDALERSGEQALFDGALCFWSDVDRTFREAGTQRIVAEVQRISLAEAIMKNGTLQSLGTIISTATSSSTASVEAFLSRYGITHEESIIPLGGLICF